MRILSIAVGAAVFVGAAHAYAADVPMAASGTYFAIAGGYNNISKGEAITPNRTPQDIRFKFNDGLAASFSAGYRTGGGLRGEFEFTYRSNGVKNFNSAVFPLSGHQDDISLMANAFFDFNTNTRFTPYIGAGVGATMLWWHDFASASSTRIVRDTGGTKLAFQGIVGVSYAFSPEWQATLDGRYKGSSGHSFAGLNSSADDVTGFHLRDTTVMVGLRYNM